MDNAFPIYAIATVLEIAALRTEVQDYVTQQISAENSTAILKKSMVYDSMFMIEKCVSCLATEFVSIQSAELVQLPFYLFLKIISSPHLNIYDEFFLYERIRTYIASHSLIRPQQIATLIEAIRLPYLTTQQLQVMANEGLVPSACVLEALLQKLAVAESKSLPEKKLPTRLRKRPVIGRTCLHKSDFDQNGVIYYIGSKGQTSTWQNPFLTGDVELSASSLQKGELASFIGRQTNEVWTEPVPSSWIALHLKKWWLVPHAYTLRHGSNSNRDCLRSWILQASSNGEEWYTLARHTGDTSLNSPFATFTWKTENQTAESKRRYRHFRIVQTSLNAGHQNLLSICGWELYGVLYREEL